MKTAPASSERTATRKGPFASLAARVLPDVPGYPLFPLFVLFALNLVDEFDIQAVSILGPNIRDAFGLSNAGLAGLRTAAALPGLLIPFIGILGDRGRRVRMCWIA